MKLKYYLKDMLKDVEIFQPCPGCGRMDKLAMRDKVISYMHDRTEYYVGCNCGWMGPTVESPVIAAVKWECRAMIKDYRLLKASEVAKILHVCSTQVYRLMATELPSVRFGGGTVRVRPEDLQQYMIDHLAKNCYVK